MDYIKTFESFINKNEPIVEDVEFNNFDEYLNEGISIGELLGKGKELTTNILKQLEQWFYKGMFKIINLIKSAPSKVVGMIQKLYNFIKKLENSNPVVFKALCMMLLVGVLIVASGVTASAATGGSPELNDILNNLLHVASGLASDLELQNYNDLDIVNALTSVKDQMMQQGNADYTSAIEAANIDASLKSTIEDLFMNADFLKAAAEKTGNADIQQDVLQMAKKGASHMMDTYLNSLDNFDLTSK